MFKKNYEYCIRMEHVIIVKLHINLNYKAAEILLSQLYSTINHNLKSLILNAQPKIFQSAIKMNTSSG